GFGYREPVPSCRLRVVHRDCAFRDPTHMSLRTPIIAITLGDPSGVGPEIARKALAERHRATESDELTAIMGGARHTRGNARSRCAPELETRGIEKPSDAVGGEYVYVLDVLAEQVDVSDPVSSQGTAAVGAAAHDALRTATQLALAGEVEAVVTAPLNKEA